MARALMLCQGETIQPQHLPMRPRKKTGKLVNERISLREGYRQIIEATLQECGGNLSEAARQLQIARSTFYRKMNEFGIS